MKISPIETRYAGCRFRSRTEARVAVFLDHLSITWKYEEQGYQLPSGRRYLPDFVLPDLKIFLEIKGADPTDRELGKVREFAVAANEYGYVTLMLVGGIPRPEPDTWPIMARSFGVFGFADASGDGITPWVPDSPHRMRAAMTAACSARFEFGESG